MVAAVGPGATILVLAPGLSTGCKSTALYALQCTLYSVRFIASSAVVLLYNYIVSVTEDEFSKKCHRRLQLGRRQSSIEERMDREGRLLIGFCSFSFGAVPIRTL